MTRIKDFVFGWLKVPFSVSSMILMGCFHRFLGHVESRLVLLLVGNRGFKLMICHFIIVVRKILSSSKFLHHHHLVLSHLWSHLQESILLLILSQIDNVCPSLLVFGLEISEELIERLVFLSHFSNTLIKGFTLVSLVGAYEILQLLNLLNGPWSGKITLLASFTLFILEKQHLVFLIFVLVRVYNHLLIHALAIEATVHIRKRC
jgi:hypothetical protein